MKRVYAIKGFDCVACACNAEAHLNGHPQIESASIDYAGERLCVISEDETLDEEALKAIIAEVEEDEIEIFPFEQTPRKKSHKSWILWARIGYCLAVFLVCGFAFRDSYWVRFALYLSALLVIVYDIALKVFKNIIKKRNPIDENLLMFLASCGAFVLASVHFALEGEATTIGNAVFILEEHFEAILVCLLYHVGEFIQDLAVKQSRKAIEKAVDSRPEEANLVTQEGIKRIDASEVKAGDLFRVALGDKVPADGVVESGEAYGDASSLTGEFVPITLQQETPVYAGTMITDGEALIRANKDYASSASARIMELVSSSLERKGQAERFITRFARWYTPVVFLIAIAYALIAGFVGGQWRASIFTGLEILVISCPCALVISVPLAYFAAIGLGSKHGIVIKGASYLDTLCRVKTVVTDKTGTLTKGDFVVTESSLREEDKRLLLSLEASSSHPLGKAIVREYGNMGQLELSECANLPGFGVVGSYQGEEVAAGNAALMERLGIAYEAVDGAAIYLSRGKEYLGYALLEDAVKETTDEFVKSLQKRHISLLMLSGDHPKNVANFAQKHGIEHAKGGLLPADKLTLVEEDKKNGGLIYLGDGVNDAPCLAAADVGMAMGGLGSDLAVEEADVVLLQDDPLSVIKTLRIARMARNTIIFNIAFALLSKIAVMVLAIIFGEKMPMEVAVLADTGVSVLLTLNSLLLLCRKP